jgi:CDP-diacylglycerol--serine O-phosphatidyltransferase
MFTAASIFIGTFSMVSSINGDFVLASWLIVLALVFDALDGRVARLTNTCSRFGVEFDSLADIVSFGVAPALLMYMYIGSVYGRIGIVVSAMFVVLGAIRLARFNVTTAQIEPSVFIGVPIPTAAVFISLLTLIFEDYAAWSHYKFLILVAAVLMSLLMVSNIRYPSFKKVDFKPAHYMRLLITVLVVASLIVIYPKEGFALVFIVYIFYGLIRAVLNMVNRSHILKKR